MEDYVSHLRLKGVVNLKAVRLRCTGFLRWVAQLPDFGGGQAQQGLDLTRLRPWMLQQYQGYLNRRIAEGQLKHSTVRGYIQILRRWLAFLYASDSLDVDFSRFLTVVRGKAPAWERCLTPEQCTALLDAIVCRSRHVLRDVTLCGALMLGSGCRPCEALRLTAADLAWIDGRLWVHYVGKGGQRWVVLPGVSQRVVELYLAEVEVGSDKPLFPGVTYEQLRRRFNRWRCDAGIGPHVGGPHVLRHTFATYSAEGADIRWLAAYLGHTSLSHTATYVHRDADGAAELMRRFPRLMPGSEGRDSAHA